MGERDGSSECSVKGPPGQKLSPGCQRSQARQSSWSPTGRTTWALRLTAPRSTIWRRGKRFIAMQSEPSSGAGHITALIWYVHSGQQRWSCAAAGHCPNVPLDQGEGELWGGSSCKWVFGQTQDILRMRFRSAAIWQ